MTEPQVRGTDPFGSPAEKLHDQLAHVLNRGVRVKMIDAALDWERRRTVERIRKRLSMREVSLGPAEAFSKSSVSAILNESESSRG